MSKITIKRLVKLCEMLNKNSHRWCALPGDESSQRMNNWVDEYNEARGSAVWIEYCKTNGYDYHHDAYDCMA